MSGIKPEVSQYPVQIPGGERITENGPVVIVGPNGSGKSRRSRELTSDVQIEVISALRNTRISQQLQPMALGQARQNFVNQRETARHQPYEPTNDFDFMLTALIGDALEVSLEYLRAARADEEQALPPLVALERIQDLWGHLFPGRELRFKDYMPIVINTVAVGDQPQEYSAWQMSDGEKAALYLAGRALAADAGAVLLIDEPETHFHSLLAVEFWDAIERERPDLRLIYVTHDMTFAASRRAVQYLLANPVSGLAPIELASDAGDLAAVLLGTASLSFYANKIVFCEGEPDSLDVQLYGAWFNEKETVVQPVGSCDMVIRSASALGASSLIQNLDVRGIIDRDFHSKDRLKSLPAGISPLEVHEVESLFSLPDVVAAIAAHLGVIFDKAAYIQKIIQAFDDSDRHKVVLERWKLRVEGNLGEIVGSVSTKTDSLDDIAASIPTIFDYTQWSFSPSEILAEEKKQVEGLFDAAATTKLDEIVKLMPGKKLRSLGTGALGIKQTTFDQLLITAIRGEDPTLESLGTSLRTAMKPYMPKDV